MREDIDESQRKQSYRCFYTPLAGKLLTAPAFSNRAGAASPAPFHSEETMLIFEIAIGIVLGVLLLGLIASLPSLPQRLEERRERREYMRSYRRALKAERASGARGRKARVGAVLALVVGSRGQARAPSAATSATSSNNGGDICSGDGTTGRGDPDPFNLKWANGVETKGRGSPFHRKEV